MIKINPRYQLSYCRYINIFGATPKQWPHRLIAFCARENRNMTSRCLGTSLKRSRDEPIPTQIVSTATMCVRQFDVRKRIANCAATSRSQPAIFLYYHHITGQPPYCRHTCAAFIRIAALPPRPRGAKRSGNINRAPARLSTPLRCPYIHSQSFILIIVRTGVIRRCGCMCVLCGIIPGRRASARVSAPTIHNVYIYINVYVHIK